MTDQVIRLVRGPEPMREGEYPDVMWVGYGKPAVHSIVLEESNLGTYGIMWYVARDEVGVVIKKMNALHVAYVEYFAPDKDKEEKLQS